MPVCCSASNAEREQPRSERTSVSVISSASDPGPMPISRIMSTTLRISFGTILATLLAGGAAAQVWPAEHFATPFEGPMAPLYLPAVPSDGARIASGGQSVSLGADNIVSYQCVDGGWGWPLICPPTYHNITAPIALGLLHAYD